MRRLITIFFACLLVIPLPAASSPLKSGADSELKLGIFPRRNAVITQKMFQPLVEHLSKQLGRKVILETTHDFASFWDNVANKRYDIVHYNQYHYLKSHKLFGYRVIAQNVEFGHEQIAGAILVRQDSGIKSVLDLKGKTVVFGGGRGAMQAYITATYLLRQAGLKQGDYFEQFALNPPKACIATFYRKAKAAGAGNYVLDLPHVKKQINTKEMKYLVVSNKMAHLPWALKDSISEDSQNRIQQVLADLHQTKAGMEILKSAKLTRISKASDSDYNAHREIVKAVLNEEL